MKQFSVIKKSAGYSVKSFTSEQKAKEFASKCCEANNNKNYIVCIWQNGSYTEI